MRAWSREERFDRLWAAAHPTVRSFVARRLGGGSELDDVVADTFVVAWRRLDDVPADPEQAVRWLRRVAQYGIQNARRARRRREALVERARAAAPSTSVHAIAVDGPERRRLMVAFAQLAASDQAVLLSAGWEGLAGAALAERLGCSSSAAATRLSRARARLADAMDRTEELLRGRLRVLYSPVARRGQA